MTSKVEAQRQTEALVDLVLGIMKGSYDAEKEDDGKDEEDDVTPSDIYTGLIEDLADLFEERFGFDAMMDVFEAVIRRTPPESDTYLILLNDDGPMEIYPCVLTEEE